jgi:hypothetical protein
MGLSGQRHAPAALYPRGKTHGTHCTGGWVGPRAGLDTEDRGKIPSPLPGIEHRSPGRPGGSQTLYCLSYPLTVFRYPVHCLEPSCSGQSPDDTFLNTIMNPVIPWKRELSCWNERLGAPSLTRPLHQGVSEGQKRLHDTWPKTTMKNVLAHCGETNRDEWPCVG